MSKSFSSSVLGLFHTENQKELFEASTLNSWGSHVKRSTSIGAPLWGSRKPLKNILHSQQQKATNERHEILLERSANDDRPSGEAGEHSSTPPSDPTLFSFIFNILPPSVNTSSMQTICRASHIYSLQHMSLLFFPFYINLTLPLLSSPSLLFLSPPPALVFCPGSYIFP